jgi:hypothetical protein
MGRSRDGPSWSSEDPRPAGPSEPPIPRAPELTGPHLQSFRKISCGSHRERGRKSVTRAGTGVKRLRVFFGGMRITDVTPEAIGRYITWRSPAPARRRQVLYHRDVALAKCGAQSLLLLGAEHLGVGHALDHHERWGDGPRRHGVAGRRASETGISNRLL